MFSAFAFHSNAQLNLYAREEVFITICDAANDAMPVVREQVSDIDSYCNISIHYNYLRNIDIGLSLARLFSRCESDTTITNSS